MLLLSQNIEELARCVNVEEFYERSHIDGKLLLLLLRHFSHVRLCATP